MENAPDTSVLRVAVTTALGAPRCTVMVSGMVTGKKITPFRAEA